MAAHIGNRRRSQQEQAIDALEYCRPRAGILEVELAPLRTGNDLDRGRIAHRSGDRFATRDEVLGDGSANIAGCAGDHSTVPVMAVSQSPQQGSAKWRLPKA